MPKIRVLNTERTNDHYHPLTHDIDLGNGLFGTGAGKGKLACRRVLCLEISLVNIGLIAHQELLIDEQSGTMIWW